MEARSEILTLATCVAENEAHEIFPALAGREDLMVWRCGSRKRGSDDSIDLFSSRPAPTDVFLGMYGYSYGLPVGDSERARALHGAPSPGAWVRT